MSSKHKGSFHLYYKKHYNKHRKKALEEEDRHVPLLRHKARDKTQERKGYLDSSDQSSSDVNTGLYGKRKQLKW